MNKELQAKYIIDQLNFYSEQQFQAEFNLLDNYEQTIIIEIMLNNDTFNG